ncbi:hypothetical protein B0O99DRAFT_700386 [Bisporella sp. PMI_857]|nr:hypothetical protein B0O99DRAFT_700386 [Bisporella sp. PMI_857]
MKGLVPIKCGTFDIPNKQNLQFTRLEPIAGGATVDGKPNFKDGACVEEIDKQVQKDLGPLIIRQMTEIPLAPVAPNFFLEAKGPEGSAGVAKRQLVMTVLWVPVLCISFDHMGKINLFTTVVLTLFPQLITPGLAHSRCTLPILCRRLIHLPSTT